MFKVTNKDIEKLIKVEYDNALEQSEKYNSNHEFYAILKEEVEEAQEKNDSIEFYLNCAWTYIKQDSDCMYYHIKCIRENAINNIKELLQVCAVCDKYLKNI